ncbi:hypothetical protein C1G87_1481 [Dehalococcoides mccartyi]|uniref:Uncharacterized protein n=1 Tax=Dehalococcoides mccartyi TaxID=61435 RepID=A0A328EJU3_9CHLR|nr:hypothetical protein C1G87_1481 [Dehalococcoides mccartyi]
MAGYWVTLDIMLSLLLKYFFAPLMLWILKTAPDPKSVKR